MSCLKFSVVTLFPNMFDIFKQDGVIGTAIEKNLVSLESINLRDFSDNKRKSVDDSPVGGADGMILRADIIYQAIQSLKNENSYIVNLAPHGKVFHNQKAMEYAQKKHIILLCGRYGGIDSRISENVADENISIGDFVLSGGELPAMCVIDSVCRFIPQVLGNQQSNSMDSFQNGLLEPPQYTKPNLFMNQKIPEILFSGDHQKISKFQRKEQIKLTAKYRPDLLIIHWESLTKSEKELAKKFMREDL